MRVGSLNVGLERITRWNIDDEAHLPLGGGTTPAFLPQTGLLNEILSRPSLDERLSALIQPSTLDPTLLDPAVLTKTRAALHRFFAARAEEEHGHTFTAAAGALGDDMAFDQEIRASLALLLRG